MSSEHKVFILRRATLVMTKKDGVWAWLVVVDYVNRTTPTKNDNNQTMEKT